MKLASTLLLVVLVISQAHGQQGWYHLINTAQSVGAVYFVDTLNGWMAGDTVKKTTDGGLTWTAKPLPVNQLAMRVYFVNQMTGFSCTTAGSVFKTTDGGETWVAKASGINTVRGSLLSFCFENSQVGFVCGGVVVVRTTDGGETWTTITTQTYYLYDISVSPTGIGWAVGLYGSCIKSTDDGLTWTQVSPPISGQSLLGVRFISQSKIVIASGGRIVLSTDSGITWTNTYSGNWGYSSIAFADSITGWIAGGYAILKTTNGGSSWFSQPWPPPQRYLGWVNCVDALHAWVAGDQILLGTKTGGSLTSIHANSAEIPSVLLLFRNYPNPFNPTTTIRFQIPSKSFVTLKIYDVLGREVATLVEEEMEPGNYERVFDGSGLASGIYLYRLKTETFASAKKLMLLK